MFLARNMVVTCFCVFTLSCFLAKFVIPSLIVVRYIKEKVLDVRSRNDFRNSFYGSMENVVCVCAASLVEKEIRRRNGVIRKRHVSWDVRGIVFAVV